jgi:TPP-dependent 2-oxoacid decarboxylase
MHRLALTSGRAVHAPVTAARCILTADNALSEIERCLTELFITSTPIYINLPQDVSNAPPAPPRGHIALSGPSRSDPGSLSQAVGAVKSIMDAAQRPVVLADIGVLRSDCAKELAALLEHANLPCATLSMGRGCLSESHPSHVVRALRAACPVASSHSRW